MKVEINFFVFFCRPDSKDIEQGCGNLTDRSRRQKRGALACRGGTSFIVQA